MGVDNTPGAGANTVGWENHINVENNTDKEIRDSFAAAKAAGSVKIEPMRDFQVIALKAELAKGTRSHDDRTVDLGNGEQLVSRNRKVYLISGDNYSQVTGYQFPAIPLAMPRW